MSRQWSLFRVVRNLSLVFGLALVLGMSPNACHAAEKGSLERPESSAPGEVIVACPSKFQRALAPWIAHRRAQGFVVTLVDNSGTAEKLRTRIQSSFSGNSAARFVVLVGDAPERNSESIEPEVTSTFFIRAKVNKTLGGGEDIASDNPFADFDNDGLPEAAVGRLPADTAEELELLVEKILDYENGPPGAWQRRINFIAGVGGFGMLADRAIEMGARRFITRGIPSAFLTSMTYASWRSPYYPGGENFKKATQDRLNEGSLFSVYIGHGNRSGLDYVREKMPFGGVRAYPILTNRDVNTLTCESGAPIALFLACYTGSFDGENDSLAEELLRRKGGPIAAVCGSRVTMPYGMSVLGNELIQQCFVERRSTLGELMQHAKRGTIENDREDETSQLLDNVASLLNVHGDLAAERLEHLSLFNLIGDPLLRINLPEDWDVQAPEIVKPGDRIEIRVAPKFSASVQIELCVKHGELTFDPPVRGELRGSKAELDELWDTYTAANQPILVAAKTDVRADKEYRVALKIPKDTRSGEYQIRVLAIGQEKSAVGSANLQIQ